MKTTQEMIAVMQAFVNGKEIEFYDSSDGMWYLTDDPMWDWLRTDYRIKPEHPKQKIVPYESAEEFLAAMKEHGPFIYNPYNVPTYEIPVLVCDEGIEFTDYIIAEGEKPRYPYKDLLKHKFKWQDGSPIGKEVTE